MSVSIEANKFEWTRADGTAVPGFAFGAAEAQAGVIVVQEWWGVAEWTKAQADRFAQKGYRVLIPDLYRGKVSLEAAEASHLMHGLDWMGAVEDIRGAARALKAGGCTKVGIVGFCMGGALSLASGVHVEEIDCAAPFYGTPPDALADVRTIKKPILGHFGTLDKHAGFSDAGAVDTLEAKLKEAGVEYELVRVPDVDHGYMNFTQEGRAQNDRLGRPAINDAAVEASYDRVLAFFAKHLSA